MEASPKRALTSDMHDAIVAANSPRHDFISDDLTARLQNVGARVRKSVADGYVSSPSQSPSKPHHHNHHPSSAGFAPTSSEIMATVYGSPTPAAAATRTLPSPSPSPRKRARDDVGRDADAMVVCSADECDSDSDDEVLITPTVVSGGFPNVCGAARPMRPLRRSRFPQPSFAPAVQQLPVGQDVVMDYLPSSVLHHHHHSLSLGVPMAATVTVGGGDDFTGPTMRV